jgi:transposase InsO family protein
MEETWRRDRVLLDQLLHRHPDWTVPQLAREVGRSLSWVKTWRLRLRSSDPEDLNRFSSRSRAHHAPYFRWDESVEDGIITMRESPPENLHRVPGPKALLYYLPRDPELQELDVALPRSTRTIWKILHRLGLIAERGDVKKQPLPPREPLEEVQMDFKDASTVPSSESPQGKKQHVIEVCNFVDAGTSTLLSAQASEDFHAQTAIQAVIAFLQEYGCPRMITFDRDPRWVGSSSGRDFPSALRRMLLCLGITPNVCPPHHPEKNPYVERYHKSYGQECLEVFRPGTLQEVREVTETFKHHYNLERPHQGRACKNLPPGVAFPQLPTLPPLPHVVDPDSWLQAIDGKAYVRRVGSDGCVDVSLEPYYIGKQWAGQYVTLHVESSTRLLRVWHGTSQIKELAIKKLVGRLLPLQEFLDLMTDSALADTRRGDLPQAKGLRQLKLW